MAVVRLRSAFGHTKRMYLEEYGLIRLYQEWGKKTNVDVSVKVDIVGTYDKPILHVSFSRKLNDERERYLIDNLLEVISVVTRERLTGKRTRRPRVTRH